MFIPIKLLYKKKTLNTCICYCNQIIVQAPVTILKLARKLIDWLFIVLLFLL